MAFISSLFGSGYLEKKEAPAFPSPVAEFSRVSSSSRDMPGEVLPGADVELLSNVNPAESSEGRFGEALSSFACSDPFLAWMGDAIGFEFGSCKTFVALVAVLESVNGTKLKSSLEKAAAVAQA